MYVCLAFGLLLLPEVCVCSVGVSDLWSPLQMRGLLRQRREKVYHDNGKAVRIVMWESVGKFQRNL